MLVQCNKTQICVSEAEPLTCFSKNVFEVGFVFDEAWRGLAKTVVFLSGETAVSIVLGSSNRCTVPYEVLRQPQAVYVGVYGSDLERVLTTPWCLLGMVQPGAEGGEPIPDPTPTVYEQILELERQAVEAAEALREDAENGVFDGSDGITPTIGQNGNWYLGETDTGCPSRGERGYSGLLPRVCLPYARYITVQANTVTEIGTTDGSLEISFGEGLPGYDNEWNFTVTQGEEAYDIILPEIRWGLGIAPAFHAESTTFCRLYMVGAVLCGEWVSV